MFPNVSGLYGRKFGDKKIANSDDLVDYLLSEANVAAVAGSGLSLIHI